MPSLNDFSSQLVFTTLSIPASGTTSPAIDLGGSSLVGIQMPASFTGTSLTFQVATSFTGTYQQAIDGSGTAISKVVSAAKYLVLDPAEFAGIEHVKIVSGSTEAAQRDLVLVTRPL